jgi:hypothetical protein
MSEKRDLAERLGAQVQRLERRGRGQKYPLQLKEDLTTYAAERRAAGIGLKTIGAELSVPWRTLSRWTLLARRGVHAGICRVRVVDPPQNPTALVVHGPRGVRIEGLDVAAIADLLARLA